LKGRGREVIDWDRKKEKIEKEEESDELIFY